MAQPIKVLLVSEPPPGRLAGADGNSLIRELINSYHPAICVVAGPTLHRGLQREPHGLIINPGLLVDGSAAWIDRIVPQIDMLDL